MVLTKNGIKRTLTDNNTIDIFKKEGWVEVSETKVTDKKETEVKDTEIKSKNKK